MLFLFEVDSYGYLQLQNCLLSKKFHLTFHFCNGSNHVFYRPTHLIPPPNNSQRLLSLFKRHHDNAPAVPLWPVFQPVIILLWPTRSSWLHPPNNRLPQKIPAPLGYRGNNWRESSSRRGKAPPRCRETPAWDRKASPWHRKTSSW